MKTNLPVIVLKGIILLPHNDIRFEVDTKATSNLMDIVEMFHDNKILVVSQTNPLEETPSINQLPKIGIIGTIRNKIDLPNGKTRIVISGEVRASVIEYVSTSKENDIIESFITPVNIQEVSSNESEVLIRKLHKELENYIIKVSYVSNSILGVIESVKDLSKITDIIAPQLPIDFERTRQYLSQFSPIKRTEMILEDIYKELEMFNMEKALDKRIRHELESGQKEMILREKLKIIKDELGESSLKDDEINKMREKVQTLEFPNAIRKRLEHEINRFELLNPAAPEINVTKSYIEWLLNLPWNYSTKDNSDLRSVRKLLDESHYGLEEVKLRIIEYIAVSKMTNNLNGPILCLVGPPGVGKTSLTRAIANAMNRNFVKMSVGGLYDESEIRGNRRTYLGANPGKIIQSMRKSGSINPVFLIDEIDKMTKDQKGDPAAALLEVLDPEQNFQDNFLEEEYDLSNVMFIATANDLESIPGPLRDRLEIIELKGYTELEKLDIAKKHLIPSIIKEHGLVNDNIKFDDEIIIYIINHYTKEAGVRELRRKIAKIIRKIVTSIVSTNIKVNGLVINKNNIEKYLGRPKYFYNHNNINQIGVVNALTYNNFGGDVLPVEIGYFKGNGQIILTGNLGDVLKESAKIALSYLKVNAKKFNIDFELLCNSDIHIHIPHGESKKDGPSAGITITTALISIFTNTKIPRNYAMTGEISLRGNVLPIGSLREKVIGAVKHGIDTIFIPYENSKDLENIPDEIKQHVKFIPVKNYIEIYNYIFKKKGE